MRKTRTLLAGVTCLLIAALSVQALSQRRSVRRRMERRMQARKRVSANQRDRNGPRTKAEFEQYRKKRRKEAQERADKIEAELLYEKAALSPTPEQWGRIKPLLEKIRQLRDRPRSTAILSLTSSSTSSSQRTGPKGRLVGTWRWRKPWEDTPRSEWTEGQRTANALIVLVGNSRTSEEAFARKIETLRECRRREAAQKKAENVEGAIVETQQQLRALLSTRQEAALVLMRWL